MSYRATKYLYIFSGFIKLLISGHKSGQNGLIQQLRRKIMQIIVTNNEISVIENHLETIFGYAKELFSAEEMPSQSIKEQIAETIESVNGEWLEDSIIFTIPEEKVCEYLDILGSAYSLVFKIAKIVKPTVEATIELLKNEGIGEDIKTLTKKIENF